MDYLAVLGHSNPISEHFDFNTSLGRSGHMSEHVSFLEFLRHLNHNSKISVSSSIFRPIRPYVRIDGFS